MNMRRPHFVTFGPAIPAVPVGQFSRTGLTEEQWAGAWRLCGPSAAQNLKRLELWQVIASAYLEGLQHGAECERERKQVMQITVNGTRHDIPRGKVDHATIANLAGHPGDQFLTITYHGKRESDVQRSGILMPGKEIEGDDGLNFTAVRTGNA